MARKSTGKKLRFEIFKRDGFRCVYCGCTPVQTVLRIDHVIPVAGGGSNKPENLVTSCHDCNAGKGAVALDKKLPKPMLAEADHDHVDQIREFLKVQKEIADARRAVATEIWRHWESVVGGMTEDMFNRLIGLTQEWPYDKLIEAINITARKLGATNAEFSPYKASGQAKYFHGILRKWRLEAGNGQE